MGEAWACCNHTICGSLSLLSHSLPSPLHPLTLLLPNSLHFSYFHLYSTPFLSSLSGLSLWFCSDTSSHIVEMIEHFFPCSILNTLSQRLEKRLVWSHKNKEFWHYGIGIMNQIAFPCKLARKPFEEESFNEAIASDGTNRGMGHYRNTSSTQAYKTHLIVVLLTSKIPLVWTIQSFISNSHWGCKMTLSQNVQASQESWLKHSWNQARIILLPGIL